MRPFQLDAFTMEQHSNTVKPHQRTNNTTTLQQNKKFISLSEILNNEKATTTTITPPTLPKSIDEPTNLRFKKYPIILATNNTTPSISNSNTNVNDLLTVQELFEELQLDCDDQIKELDTYERKRKEETLKQKKILDDIKLKCQMYPQLFKVKKSQTKNGNIQSSNVKCNCFRFRQRNINGNNLVKHKVNTFSQKSFRFKHSLLKNVKYKRKQQRVKFVLVIILNNIENRKFSFYVVKNKQMQKLNKKFCLSEKKTFLKKFNERTIMDSALMKRRLHFGKKIKEEDEMRLKKDELKQSLLDKFYNKYCGTNENTKNRNVIQANKDRSFNKIMMNESSTPSNLSSLLVRRNKNIDAVCCSKKDESHAVNSEDNTAENRKVSNQ